MSAHSIGASLALTFIKHLQIEQFPNCIVEIYNRWGAKLYTSDPGYTNPWNGTYNNSPLPVGTYYYIIDLGDGSLPQTGPLTIIK